MLLRVCLPLLMALALLCAEGPTLPQVDFSGLTPAQRAAAVESLKNQKCTCQCGMTVAECRVKDPNCSYSRAMAAFLVSQLRQGKTPQQAREALERSDLVRKAAAPRQLLDDPVTIPILGAPVTGPAGAMLTLVEFSDFECPYCSEAVVQLRSILVAYPRQVRLVYKQFPLSMHPHAELAAEAALAAHAQGKFWQMHDKLFANSRQLSREKILALAAEIGLDMPRFTRELDSGRYRQLVAKDIADGDAAGVNGTPTVFLNGKRFNGPVNLDALRPVLDAELHH